MPPKKKFRSITRKKKRFRGNQYSKKEETAESGVLNDEDSSSQASEREGSNSDAEHVESDKTKSFKCLPASIRKMKAESNDSSQPESSDEDPEGVNGFRLIDIAILATVFESLRCPLCKQKHVVLVEDEQSKMGLASLLILKCTTRKCSFYKPFYTSGKIENGKAYEVNRRVVLATRNIGVGHQGLVKFACVMNMLPPMNENSYRDHVQAVRDAAESVATASMSRAANEVKEFYEPDEEGIYDIGVSGDGTWRKRGFSSSYGVVTVLSTITGKALDCEIMSKECGECKLRRGKEGTPEFEEWWDGHQHKCQANFFGSSGSMDSAGILAIFQRSVEKHDARYVEFLGDGDSKAHNLLVQEAVYGDTEVEKLECVGHVQKRLGSRLRSLKKRQGTTRLEDGKGLGGRGRLTDKRIDKLQVYYGMAIRQNIHDIDCMKTAVMAIWHHSKSTDDDPDHDLCPPGENSWCGFQQDIANGTSDYTHAAPIPEAVANSILPTFEALSDETLLSRCLHGGTQNQNEAINALIWQRATKETHASAPTVELATYLAVGHFNDGARTLMSIVEELGMVPGSHCRKACEKLDHDRIRHSNRKSGEEAKKRRKQIRNWKKGFNETLEAREGPSYEAGGY